jgi:hypothetical protein
MKKLRTLAEAYKSAESKTFARCEQCKETFVDDMPNHGSIYCPNGCSIAGMRFCVVRGLKKPK